MYASKVIGKVDSGVEINLREWGLGFEVSWHPKEYSWKIYFAIRVGPFYLWTGIIR